VDFHGEMLLLVHWSILAYTGLVKILKKHHKRTGLLVRAPHLDNLAGQPFCSTEVQQRNGSDTSHLSLLNRLSAESGRLQHLDTLAGQPSCSTEVRCIQVCEALSSDVTRSIEQTKPSAPGLAGRPLCSIKVCGAMGPQHQVPSSSFAHPLSCTNRCCDLHLQHTADPSRCPPLLNTRPPLDAGCPSQISFAVQHVDAASYPKHHACLPTADERAGAEDEGGHRQAAHEAGRCAIFPRI